MRPSRRPHRPLLLLASFLLAACPGKDGESGADEGVEAPWPDWTWTPWIWEDESDQERTLEFVDGFLSRGIPTGALIIDSPWETAYSSYEFDEALYPDPQGLVDALHERGLRVMLWTVPAINLDAGALYEEAASKGYFMQEDADSGPAVVSWWKGEGSLIDFFNPEAVSWWHGLLDRALALGIDGWKADGADYYAIFARYSRGLGRQVERVEYSEAWYRDLFDHTRAELGEDRIITARPADNYGLGFGGEAVSFAPRDINWAGWVGDQDPDFAGMKAALDNMYWSADLGHVGFGSDIGGYREDDAFAKGRDKETFLRWTWLGAFCPVMENGGGGEHRPWAFDEETSAIYKAAAELHVALLPYLTREGTQAFEEGRSLFSFVDRVRYAYLLGPDLFVQPVLEAGTTVEVTLPEGRWNWIFGDGGTLEGGLPLGLEVPLDAFPAFVRQGSRLAEELR